MMPQTAQKPLTKTEIMSQLAERTELSKDHVAAVLSALAELIEKSLDSAGSFALPGLLKIERKHVPARPARSGVPNPFKPGEVMNVPAKPASTKITVRALKQLKDMAK